VTRIQARAGMILVKRARAPRQYPLVIFRTKLSYPGILLAAALASAAGAQAESLPALHLVDDRGQPIDAAVEVCFRVELRTECQRLTAGGTARSPASFYSLRIEGEDHGPVDLRRDGLQAQVDGSFRVMVPRKALLRVESNGRQQPLTLSLYKPEDPTFREPAYRVRLSPGQDEVKVPAGKLIASLALANNAPDLQRLSTQPAGRYRVTYHPHPGWSLLVRCRAAATLQPVAGAEAHAAAAVGYGQPERPLAQSVSGPDGLVLLSGLQAAMASLEVRHPSFIPAAAHALTASPGSFAFREVDLGTGGRIVAKVTIHGRPSAGATCQVAALSSDGIDPSDDPYRLLWEATVDPHGACSSSRLAQGEYKLRVRIAESSAQVSRWVSVSEAQDTEVDVALTPTRISGEVRRGGRPAPGYSVEATLIDLDQPKGARGEVGDAATADEEGRYELTLWTPGWYTLFLRSPTKELAAGHKEVTTEGDEEKTVDFDLGVSAFRGTVVDEEGRPVEKAAVAVRWAGVLVAGTDAQGHFEIDVQGEGTGTLVASKSGYRESASIDVRVEKDAPIPPVTLILKRKSTAQGTILSAGGSPVPSAWIGSAGSSPEQGPFVFSETRSAADGHFEVETPPGRPRVFLSGPGCPLSWFDVPAPAPAVLRCPPLPAALELSLLDGTGKPLPHAGVILRQGGVIVPQGALASHLRSLGLLSQSDGAGRLVLAGLSPGDYELFLSTLASESTIAGGRREGYLTTVSLPALQTTALQITLPSQP
jgi:hypothetical protein